MEDSVGDPGFPVWLVADSEPKRWQGVLLTPLDSRHPARHSIWTSVVDYMQEVFYRQDRRRLATNRMYITNAIKDSDDKPRPTDADWSYKIKDGARLLGDKLSDCEPKVVITFGAFAFEFVRRALKEEPSVPFSHWSTKRLGIEFKRRVALFDISGINVFPFLHVSISRGRFLESHKYFVGDGADEPPNYFKFVGTTLANLLVGQCKELAIWV